MEKGLVVLLTGLPCSGKTTIANFVADKLGARGYVIDGDMHRKANAFDFSREGRRYNLYSMISEAKAAATSGQTCIVAAIAPYEEDREFVRQNVEESGKDFLLVHVDTPLLVCEERDCKGLYKKARLGEIKNFTGIDDPYEEPLNPDFVVHTERCSVAESAKYIIVHIRKWQDRLKKS